MHGSIPTNRFAPAPGGRVNVPDVIPIFPLPKVVLLPGEVLPLHIFEPRYRAMTRDALAQHRVIGIVEIADDGDLTSIGESAVRPVGCVGFIAEHQELPDGRFLLWLLGLERFSIDEEVPSDHPYRQARVTYTPIDESAAISAGMHPVRAELRQALPLLVDLDDESRSQFQDQIRAISDSQLVALASQILELSSGRKRQLLEADDQVDRLMLVCEDLYRHLDGKLDLGDEETGVLN
jgi:Lon protease-like protein